MDDKIKADIYIYISSCQNKRYTIYACLLHIYQLLYTIKRQVIILCTEHLDYKNQRKVAVSFRKYVKIHKKIRATYIRERPFNF